MRQKLFYNFTTFCTGDSLFSLVLQTLPYPVWRNNEHLGTFVRDCSGESMVKSVPFPLYWLFPLLRVYTTGDRRTRSMLRRVVERSRIALWATRSTQKRGRLSRERLLQDHNHNAVLLSPRMYVYVVWKSSPGMKQYPRRGEIRDIITITGNGSSVSTLIDVRWFEGSPAWSRFHEKHLRETPAEFWECCISHYFLRWQPEVNVGLSGW